MYKCPDCGEPHDTIKMCGLCYQSLCCRVPESLQVKNVCENCYEDSVEALETRAETRLNRFGKVVEKNLVEKFFEEKLDEILPTPPTSQSPIQKGVQMSNLISIKRGNQMLPLISKIAGDIQEQWSTIIEKRTLLERLEKGMVVPSVGLTSATSEERDKTIGLFKDELNILIDKINNYIKEIESLGCFVEEFKRGIINFPSCLAGRKIFLCWVPDDVTIKCWHEMDESYNDRQLITEGKNFYWTEPVRQEV